MRIEQIDILQAADGVIIIASGNVVEYSDTLTLADISDKGLVSKEMLAGAIGGVVIVPTIVAGTSIPFFIDISLYPTITVNSDIITKATSYDPATGVATGRLQRWNDILIEDQDSNNDGTGVFTGWNIYGHDDGSGNFKEDTIVILR